MFFLIYRKLEANLLEMVKSANPIWFVFKTLDQKEHFPSQLAFRAKV